LHRFINQGLQAAASQRASQLWDDAKAAAVGTPFCDLEVSAERRCRLDSRGTVVWEKRRPVDEERRPFAPGLLQEFRDAVNFPGPGPSIHLRHFPLQLVPITLHKATHDKELLELSFPLSLRHFENGLDGLFHRRLNESAGVDDSDVRFVQSCHKPVFLLRQPSQDVLAVDEVLGATQTDDAHSLFGFHVGSCHLNT